MANAFANLLPRRNLGFAGDEGDILNEQAQNYSPSPVITNNTLAALMQPQNFIQRSGGQRINVGPSMQDVNYGGGQGYRDQQGNITTYTPSGEPVTMSAQELAGYRRQGQLAKEQQDLARRMQLATVGEKEAEMNLKNAQASGMGSKSFENSPTFKAGLSDLKRDETNVQNASELAAAYDRWLQLNSEIDTGPIAGRNPFQYANPKYQELKQLENYFSMNNFKPGQGQMSNAERAYIKGAGPQTTNDPETNASIIAVKKGAAQNMKDLYNYKEWRLQNKGNLLGADKEFQDYVEKNPQFITDKSGKLVPNQNRQDWTTYFTGAKPQAEQTTTATAQNSIPQAAIDMLKSNPGLRAHFDAKYGAGASSSVLGQ